MPDLSTFANPTTYHVLSFGTLLGSEIFQSFIAGPVAFKVLPRPSFATLQTGLFPIYFTMQAILPAAMALTFPGSPSVVGRSEGGLQGLMLEQNRWSALFPLGSIFLTGLVNLLVLGPETTKTMKQRKHQETRDGKKSYDPAPHSQEMMRLNKRFGILHGVSSLINVGAFLATVWYGATLAETMK